MNTPEFDSHADQYQQTLEKTLAIGGGDSLYYAERKFSALADYFREKKVTDPSAILDFGCGTGTNLPYLRSLFNDADLFGLDVSSRSIEVARDRAIANCSLNQYDGESIPYPPASFNLIVISNVLHHIDPREREGTLEQLSRCLRPGGVIAVFEHNPWNPLTRKIVKDCPFDVGVTLVQQSDLRKIFLGLNFEVSHLWNIVFFPAKLKALNGLERHLRWLPLGAQYCMISHWRGG
jgi:SAM-dependent methyltransferase